MVELASILVLSVLAQWLAWKIKVPAILPLIIIGLAVGPFSTFLTPDGHKLLDGDAIFSGDFLFSFVSISVGIILFEGGLTLKISEIRYRAGTIRNLLTFGPIITLVGGGLAAHHLMGLDYGLAFLFGGLIIVSGPTVVMPILRNTRPNERINTILKWEGILIDPLGALVAVLVYEFIQSGGHGDGFTLEIFQEFFLTVAAGVFVGAAAALFLRWILQKNRIPEYLRNIFTLGVVIFAFTFSEVIQPEAGLMAATFMGIILANIKVDDFKKIISFKEDITLILISVLFILLSSRIDMEQINKLGWESLILFAIVVFVLRPLAVWLSTIGKGFSWREVVFMSWVGPKGIVAAAVASLFSIQLINSGSELAQQAELILPLTFLIIVGTVVLQGSTAKMLARVLKVTRKEPKGILIAGANEVARFVAQIVKDQNLPVMMVDVSASNIKEAKAQDFDVFEGNILSEKIFDEIDLANMGRLLALTPNNEINTLADKWFEEEFGDHNTYRLASKNELELKDLRLNKTVLFQGKVDYLSLAQIMRQHDKPIIEDCTNDETFEKIQKKHSGRIIPLFILKSTEDLQVFTRDEPAFSKGDKLIYITYHSEELEKSEP